MSVIAGQVVASYRRFDASLLFSVDGLIEEARKERLLKACEQLADRAHTLAIGECEESRTALLRVLDRWYLAAGVKPFSRRVNHSRDGDATLIETMKNLIPACEQARREMSEFDRKLVEACNPRQGEAGNGDAR